jgi:chromosome segregation ATPase
MLLYTATLTLAVFQVEGSLNRIEELARSLGGYLASRNDGAITVRVPRARFQEALAEIEKVGDVLHRQVEALDVSDQVVDLEARLKNARAVRDRLAQLLQGATATKDALAIEKELARVMGEIEQLEGKLQLLSDKVAYSTVTVTFQPVRTNDVHTTARLPFPWLEGLGLGPLLGVK